MKAGDTFRFRSGEIHLWMVISDPALDRTKVLLVNMTTWKPEKEQVCLLNPGDHPEVDKNSCIPFIHAKVYPDSHLEHLLSIDRIIIKEELSRKLLQRIREAAVSSRFLRLEYGQILIDQGLVDF